MIIVRFFTIVVEPAEPKSEGRTSYKVTVTPPKRNGIGPYAYPGDLLVWDVVGNGRAEVSLRGFKRKGKAKGDSTLKLMGEAAHRRTGTRNGRIIDGVRLDAGKGNYKYDILIDGKLALDPDLQIRESD